MYYLNHLNYTQGRVHTISGNMWVYVGKYVCF